MKKVMLFFLLVPLFLEAQVGYKGSSNGSPITIDISDSRYAFAEGSKTVVVFQTKNVTLDSTLSSFIGDACDAYISMTSKKKQGVLKAGQVFSVNRGFVDKVLPITGGCVILTKDPSINFEVSTSYATVSAAMIQCASGMSSESTDAENGLYLDGTTVKMGGYLTENTVIYGDDHYMILDSLIGFSVKAINNDDAEAYLTLSTNLAQPSTLSHYEMATGNYAAVSLDGDGVSTFKSADDNDLDYAEVNVSYEDLKASMKAVVNDGVGYSEVSVAADVLIHASDDISIDCSGQIDIVNNAGSGINIGNGNSPIKITPEGSPVVADGWILGFSDNLYNLTAIDPSTLTVSLTEGYVGYGTGTGLTGESELFWEAASNELGIGTITPSSRLDITTNSLGVTQTNTSGISLVNTTAAAAGAQQISPAIRWKGNGWKTTATAASQPVEFRADILPVQGSTAPTVNWRLSSDINASGTFTDNLTVSSAGLVTATGGVVTNGALYTHSTASSSNLYVTGDQTGANSVSNSFFGGASGGSVRTLFYGNNTTTISSTGNNGANVVFGSAPIRTSSSGTNAIIANVVVRPLGTVTNAGATVTNTVTHYIENAGSGGTNNYALWVDDGVARFDGTVRLRGYTVATLPTGVVGDTAYVTDATAPTYGAALTGGGAVTIPVFFNGSIWISH